MQGTYIDDPNHYLEVMNTKKKVKIMEETLAFDESISLYDISLHKKGPMEDKIYIRKEFYFENIRRGNSLMRIGNELSFCRRGMKKFYDLEHYYIEKEMQVKDHKLTGYHEKVMEGIFNPIRQHVQNGHKIHLYKTYKENGEHCQISFIPKLDRWLVASKNVTIIIKDESELVHYAKERFIWARLIASKWLEIVSTIQDLKSFKEVVGGRTLIGEYVGNQQYQHVLGYQSIDIIFYALVDNNTQNTCLPVAEAMDIFNQFGIRAVKTETAMNFISFQDVIKQLQQWLSQVGIAPMAVEGEGSVVYIVAEKENQQKVISLCKLKSTEYLIYRKLRELLKICAQKIQQNHNFPVMQVTKRFFLEVRKIIENCPPPQPIEYYIGLAKYCFETIEREHIPFLEIRYKFVDFLARAQSGYKSDIFSLREILDKPSDSRKHTRIILLTLPLLIDDEQLLTLKDSLRLNSIDSQFVTRQPQAQTCKRALSIMHLMPKLPYNITNQAQLIQYLDASSLKNQDPLNIAFIFYRIFDEQASVQKVEDQSLIAQNSQSSSLAVQFTSAKLKDRSGLVAKWHQKCQMYLKELSNTFPDRVFQFNDNLQSNLENIYKQFEEQETKISDPIDGDDLLDLLQPEEDQQPTQPLELQTSSAIVDLVIIYPLLLPGCGKSMIASMLPQLVNNKHKVRILSSDDVSEQLMQEKSNESLQSQYSSIQSKQKQAFNQLLFKTFEDLIPLQCVSESAVIFLDRICVPSTLLSTMDNIKLIKTQLQSRCLFRIKNLGVFLPESRPQDLIENIPISYKQVLTILQRVLRRENHKTLQDDPVQKARVVLKYISLYRFVKNKQSTLTKLNLHESICLNQFTDTIIFKSNQEYEAFCKLIDQCIIASHCQRDLGEGECFSQIVSDYYTLLESNQVSLSQNDLEGCVKQDAQLILNQVAKLFKSFP